MNGKTIPMQPSLPQGKPKDYYMQHPQFIAKFGEAMRGVETPKDKIPKRFDKWLYQTLRTKTFAELNIPIHIYEELVTVHPMDMDFGTLQTAARVTMTLPPDAYTNLNDYLFVIKSVASLIDAMQDITSPIVDKVVKELKAADSIVK